MSAAAHHNDKSITEPAADKGFMYGVATLLPSSAAVMAATKRNPGFAKNVPVPVRFAMVALPALYVSHIVNGRAQQEHMAERITMLKRDSIRPSVVPHANVQDEVKQMYLRQQMDDEEDANVVVPMLNLQHRLTNSMSRKPRYITQGELQKRNSERNNDMSKTRERMMKKLKDHTSDFNALRNKIEA